MLNNNKVNTLAHFIADILTCEQCHTANDLSYWNLRLVTNGTLIDAFHWETAEYPLQYENRDGILVLGR